MKHIYAPVSQTDADTAAREILGLWKPLYDPRGDASEVDVSHADQQWKRKQDQHLPLTLSVIRGRGLDVRTTGRMDDPTVQYCTPANGDEKALILMVGFSVEQLALCIAFHYLAFRCRKFVAFGTEESIDDFYSNYPGLLRLLIHDDLLMEREIKPICGPVVDPNDPSDVFKKVVGWIRSTKGDPEYRLLSVDVTGGQKPMDAGASAAAGFYRVPAFYLDFTEYVASLRRPRPDSLRYRRLALPNVTFSHHGRVALEREISNANFERAAILVDEIKESAENEFKKYFDDWQRKNLEEVALLVRDSRRWLEQGYAEDIDAVAPNRQPAALKDFWQKNRSATPRRMIEKLLRSCNEDSTDQKGGPWLLFEYIVDEYYRLKLLHDQEHFRDVVMGSHGLAELVTDAMLYLPWFKKLGRLVVKQSSIEHTTTTKAFKTYTKSFDEAELENELTKSFQEFLDARPEFFPAFLHLKQRQEKALLTKGNANFVLWARPSTREKQKFRWGRSREGRTRVVLTVEAKVGDKSSNTLRVMISESLREPDQPADPADNQVAAKRPRESLDIPWREWDEIRNALTHLRSPFTKATEVMSDRIIQTYLPRIIELFYRLADKRMPIDLHDVIHGAGCTWMVGERWLEASCVPWKKKGDDHVKNLLELKL